MTKQRKHQTPSRWEEQDSGKTQHPHTEVKIVGQKKVGFESMDQELDNKKPTKGLKKEEK